MADSIRTDVLVIGGGPAGLAAAVACREHGREMLVNAGFVVFSREVVTARTCSKDASLAQSMFVSAALLAASAA